MAAVKICGLKTLADVALVNQYLPEYIGFVFANTKRFVTDTQALTLKQALDPRIRAVGVFVDEPMEHIINLYQSGIIDIAQLHGGESETYLEALKQQTNITIIKAAKVQSAEQVYQQISQQADYMLYDTYKKGELGGTGTRFPLEILEETLTKLTDQDQTVKPYFIAGGLDAENVEAVIGKMNCYGVDVSTGVETGGGKDGKKIEEFIQAVRNCKGKAPSNR